MLEAKNSLVCLPNCYEGSEWKRSVPKCTGEFVVNILLLAARLSDRDAEDFRDMSE